MATGESPITRTDLRAELGHYATKEDLASLETRLVKWIVGQMLAAIVCCFLRCRIRSEIRRLKSACPFAPFVAVSAFLWSPAFKDSGSKPEHRG